MVPISDNRTNMGLPPAVVTIIVENNNSCKIVVTTDGASGSVDKVSHTWDCTCMKFGKSSAEFANALHLARKIPNVGISVQSLITYVARTALGVPIPEHERLPFKLDDQGACVT